MLLEPKDFEVDGRKFIISKFPAVEGREIISKYPLSGIPKLGDYAVNEETMFKLMKYVAVKIGDSIIPLSTRELINSHTGDWETLIKVEWEMLGYNSRFFRDGRLSTFLKDLSQKLPAWISKMLTDSLGQSLLKEKPHSTN